MGKAGNEYATALNNLATIYDNTGRYSEAEPLFEEALSIRRRLLGADHPDTAVSLNNLAGLYRIQGRYDDAEPLFEEALSIRARVGGGSSEYGLCVKIMTLAEYEGGGTVCRGQRSVCIVDQGR